ncbi:hypothetical protein ACFPIJ_41090 [Dactylosporangium cerinum]|uniref:Uncharacterized protein n=1 Tax=Dactylosporangium cerinum TaxID=1434730 RepID=A0ABV9W9F3_9ACTN
MHDGAQQQLVALAVHLQKAETPAGSDEARAALATCRTASARRAARARSTAPGRGPR